MKFQAARFNPSIYSNPSWEGGGGYKYSQATPGGEIKVTDPNGKVTTAAVGSTPWEEILEEPGAKGSKSKSSALVSQEEEEKSVWESMDWTSLGMGAGALTKGIVDVATAGKKKGGKGKGGKGVTGSGYEQEVPPSDPTMMIIALGGLAVLVLGGAAFFFMSGKKDEVGDE